jgi:flagellar basal-body rod protein FlgB
MSSVLDGLASQIEHYMDLVSSRQKLVASNIANADTPGYKTRDIDFASELRSFMSSATPGVQEVEGLKTKNDGNNVSLDREARLLTENDMRFNIATQMMKSEIKDLKNAIEEGRSA